MFTRISFARIAPAMALALLGACSAKPGTRAWCEKIKRTPQIQVSIEDAQTFMQKCGMVG